MIFDFFGGPGGWDLGARAVGLDPIGVERDGPACATRAAAGLRTIRADVATLPLWHIDGTRGVIASPPCPGFSSAGKKAGYGDFDRLRAHLALITGEGWRDPVGPWDDWRSPLVLEPLRAAWQLLPEWVAVEQVPGLASLWIDFAAVLTEWGFKTWTGVLNAADYGVPQTRRRAILIAHRTKAVGVPAPTHAERPTDTLFDGALRPWVPMAHALPRFAGLHLDRRADYDDDGVSTIRLVDLDVEPAPTVTGVALGFGVWRLLDRRDGNSRPITKPGFTIVASHDNGNLRWVRPGYDAVAETLTIEDALALQGFPAGYPLAGSRRDQFQQVGNAVPPRLAEAVLKELTR